MKIVAILQARMGSTRLKNKMLMPLLDKPLVQHVLERVQRAKTVDQVVLAVPSRDVADFVTIAQGRAYLYGYAGDESDLVGRYLSAAQAFDADVIVRIPCDNPCVDPEYIDQAVSSYMNFPTVFYSNTTALSDVWLIDGIGCEVFSLSRLQWLDQRTQGRPDYREHPHQYFYDHGIARLPPSNLKLDVNTQEEYEKVHRLYAHFGHNRFTTQDILYHLFTKEALHESIQREQPSGNSQQRA